MKEQTDENGRPLTYWGGLEKSKQESYICPHTNVQCDDECCVSAENCNINNKELDYPVLEDCEAVKNWDIFVEQKNEELYVEKLAGDYALNRGVSKGIEQRMIDGFVAGYNKAREKYKYTDEDIIKAIDMARLQGHESFLVKYREEEIIQSLKQK